MSRCRARSPPARAPMTSPSAPIPASRCAACGEQLELLAGAFSAALDAARPKPGAASMCASCGHVMVFADDLMLREPSAEEQRQLDADPMVQWLVRLHRRFLQEKTKH